MADKRLIIGISGASGAPLALELIRRMHDEHPEVETHLVITRGGELTLQHECGISSAELSGLVSRVHSNDEIGADIASGSFKTLGMVILPCSMKTVAGIASGYSDNLLLRAADVCLKERRTLVLAARECPMSTLHLKNLYEVSSLGAFVMPPVLTYYNRPETLADCEKQFVSRVLDRFGLDESYPAWRGMENR